MSRSLHRRPRVGLALSGGGARGLAHIGVLKALRNQGIPIDLLAGTSMGGLIASGYAVGLSPEQMEEEALRMGRLRRLSSLMDRDLPRTGLFEGKRVQEYLARTLGPVTFADLRVPLGLVAVDLLQAEAVVLRNGSVVEAVRATISLPGIFAPLRAGDRLLVDGGVLNNLPVDVVREMGADVVIGVDVQTEANGLHTLQDVGVEGNLLDQWRATLTTLRTCLVVMQQHLTEEKIALARPEVVIRPVMPKGVTILVGFNRAEEIIAAGETAAEAALPEIERFAGPHAGPLASTRWDD